MNLLKQVVGIDVSKNTLDISLGRLQLDLTIELHSYKVFKNTLNGFEFLLEWVKKNTIVEMELLFVMEATGVYHQKLAYFLDGLNQKVSIVLPNKVSNYIRTLENKTITDKSCSQAIARFGLERKLSIWVKPKDIYKRICQLTRERDQVVAERVIVKNQLHAEKSESEPHENTLLRLKERIVFLTNQENEIKKDINILVINDQELKRKVELVCSIPSVGKMTAIVILGETNGFELIRNKKQLVSYAGLDVIDKESGTSVKKKPKISKKGNRHIRKSLYMPSLSAIKYNNESKDLFIRIVSKNGLKMKGLVAVQRKLLELIYTVCKTDTPYLENYEKNKKNRVLSETETLYAG